MAATVLGKRNRTSDSCTGNHYNVYNATAPANAVARSPVLPSCSVKSRVNRRAPVRVHVDCDASPAFVQAHVAGEGQDIVTASKTFEEISLKRLRHLKSASSSAGPAQGHRSCALSPCKANPQDQPARTYEDDENDECSVQLPTPKTPRHRDALSKRVPITPRHRIGLVGKPLTPRFTRTPSSSSNAPTVYDTARQLFTRNTDPGRLIGRIEERKKIRDFIQQGVDTKAGGCLYVSGPPGTGKSALVGEVCGEIGEGDSVKAAYLNCMSVKSSGEVCHMLVDKLLGNQEVLEQDCLKALRALFLPKKKVANYTYVVTLDEIDHLLTLDLEILYTLFEWSLQQPSRLIIVGIANALDLTDRFLPRLKARNFKPQLLPFLPYTAGQIAEVITTKLCTLLTEDVKDQPKFVPFVHPVAIQLCSKKVAFQTGDLRKAFDIVRRTIDLVEFETKQKFESLGSLETSPSRKPLAENPNVSSPSSYQNSSMTALTPFTAPRAAIAHVSRVSAAALSNGTSQRLATLNLQQKAALCALISHQAASRREITSSIFTTPSKSANKPLPPTVRKLFETYYSLCKKENAFPPLTATEFVDVVSGLETLGLVGEEKKKGLTLGVKSGLSSRKGMMSVGGVMREERRVVCFVDEKEVQGCLDGAGGAILRSLLD